MAVDIDLTQFTATELDTLLQDLNTEMERRSALTRIPQQVNTMADQYVSAGGDPQVLHDKIPPGQQ